VSITCEKAMMPSGYVERGKGRKVLLEEELSRVIADIRNWGVKKVILFGSMARGEVGRASDLDLLIIQETSERFLDRPDAFYERIKPRVAMDILVYTPEEAARMQEDSSFVRRVLREGRVLYEAES
jgi:predicted nucleotidyltransferase